MRLFVALGLPEAYQQSLAELTGRLSNRLNSKITWIKPGAWHLTLKFLGETKPHDAEAVRKALAAVRFDSFPLRARGAGFFPGPQRPRVIWVGLAQGAGECASLAQCVNQALEPAGFAREKKEFRPHLTLGRVRRDLRDPWKEVASEIEGVAWPQIRIDDFTLYESLLTPQGPVYTPLHHVMAKDVKRSPEAAPASEEPAQGGREFTRNHRD
jgi:2'-5' RNA ligase